MNILITGDFHFPFGDAGGSRMRHFAMGLTELGASVRVVSCCKGHYRPEDKDDNGALVYKGVRYQSMGTYACHSKRNHSIFGKLQSQIDYYRDARMGNLCAKAIIDSDSIDVVLQYGRRYSSLLPMSRFCGPRKTALIRDAVEWPGAFFDPGGPFHPRYLDYQLGMRKGLLASDGIICISRFLEEYYTRHGIPTVRIPAVVEIQDDLSFDRARSKRFNVTYLGSLVRRNGPLEMVLAVRKLLYRNIPLVFTVVGSAGTDGYGAKIRRLCSNDPLLRDNVVFLGRVSDEEVATRLRLADVLVFSRPDDVSARAAFPTRLPEYLMSGRPVVVAGVGDIPLYLRNEVHAMIVNPCTSDAIAEAIEKLYFMPDQGRAIAISGFHQAKEYFDYRKRSQELFVFFQRIFNSKAHNR